MKKALIYFIVFVVCNILGEMLSGLLSFAEGAEGELYKITVSSTLTFLITVSLFLACKWCSVGTDFMRSRPYAILSYTALLAFALLIPSALLEEMLPKAVRKDLMEDVFSLLASHIEGYLVICIFAPVMEEMVFRGAITRQLIAWAAEKTATDGARKTPSAKGAWLAIVISAMLFSAIHMNPAQMPHAFMIGIILAWLYYRTDSILPGVIYHWINNSVAFGMLYLFPDIPYDASIAEYFGNDVKLLAIAVIVSLILFIFAFIGMNSVIGRKRDMTLKEPER